jgi:hypothetical protein
MTTVPEQRHIIRGDLGWLEYAIADYIVRWGQHLPGVHPDTTAGTPCAVANMAMTVIRKSIVTSWTEPVTLAEAQPAGTPPAGTP